MPLLRPFRRTLRTLGARDVAAYASRSQASRRVQRAPLATFSPPSHPFQTDPPVGSAVAAPQVRPQVKHRPRRPPWPSQASERSERFAARAPARRPPRETRTSTRSGVNTESEIACPCGTLRACIPHAFGSHATQPDTLRADAAHARKDAPRRVRAARPTIGPRTHERPARCRVRAFGRVFGCRCYSSASIPQGASWYSGESCVIP